MAGELSRAALVPGADALELRRLLSRFAGALRVHSAMESDALYPALLAHEDPAVRRVAERLYQDLGGLYATFYEFLDRWDAPDAIASRMIRFRIELIRVLAVLGRRMSRENRELYPLADSLDASGAA